MGARGAMAPTNFDKDVFGTHDGTHEILESPYNWHPRYQISNAPSAPSLLGSKKWASYAPSCSTLSFIYLPLALHTALEV